MKKELTKEIIKYVLIACLGGLIVNLSSYSDKVSKALNYPSEGVKQDSILNVKVCSKLDTSTYNMREFYRIEKNNEILNVISELISGLQEVRDQQIETNGYLKGLSDNFNGIVIIQLNDTLRESNNIAYGRGN